MTIIGIDTKYGANGGTVNTALTPDLLDAGSVGIYTVDTDGTFKLVTKGSAGTGKVVSTTVKNGFLKFVQGLGNGDFYVSEEHDVKGIQKVSGSKYRAGSAEVIYIGYNPVTAVGDVAFIGTASLPAWPRVDPYKREAGIKLRKRERGNNSYGPDIWFSTVVGPVDTQATVLSNLLTQINAYQEDGLNGTLFVAVLSGNNLTPPVQTASATATTGGTLVAGTYYAKVVAVNAVGQSLASNEISQVVPSGTSTNTVTWNWGAVTGATGYRVYIGTAAGAEAGYIAVSGQATATLVYTGQAKTGTSAPNTSTAQGIAITPNDIYAQYEAAVSDGLENATVSKVGKVTPSGDPYELAGLKGGYQQNEIDSNIYRGDLYTASTYEHKLPKTVNLAKTYDVYEITSINVGKDKTGQKATVDNQVSTLIAFEVQGAVLDTNQQENFEEIMIDIFPSTTAISA